MVAPNCYTVVWAYKLDWNNSSGAELTIEIWIFPVLRTHSSNIIASASIKLVIGVLKGYVDIRLL